ncbi:hypothetical protein [Micromonospora sp. NPDC005173]|uniref:hypothetical protein n=1 Tax=Micromonospora sp. NPDC005173 TaxID=3157165 RepID=UPI0033B36C60
MIDGADFILVCPDGSEDDARAFAAREIARIADELDHPKPPSEPISEVFTVYFQLPDAVRREAARRRRRSGATTQTHPWTTPEDWVPVNFAWANPALLARQMQREVDDVYAAYGLEEATRLLVWIDYTARAQALDDGTDFYRPWRNVIPWSSRERAALAADTTMAACRTALKDVEKRAAASLQDIENSAAKLADDSLRKARCEIHAEATRYLDVPGLDLPPVWRMMGGAGPLRRATADDILTAEVSVAGVWLKGKDLRALVDALGRIHDRRRALQRATNSLESAERDRLIDTFGGLKEGSVAAFVMQQVVTELSEDLTQQVMVEGATFPILFRVWDKVSDVSDLTEATAAQAADPRTPPRGRRFTFAADGEWMLAVNPENPWEFWDPMPPVQPGLDYAIGKAINDLKEAIWYALRDAWRENAKFADAIKKDKDHVWRYEPLIARILDQLKFRDPSVGFRAALDRVRRESGPSWIDSVNIAVGSLSVAGWMAGGVAPPIGLGLAVLGAVFGVWGTVLDLWNRHEQNAAYDAVLDPGKAVASPTGYIGVFVGVVFSVLDIKGVKEALTAVRASRSIASTAAGLVTPTPRRPRGGDLATLLGVGEATEVTARTVLEARSLGRHAFVAVLVRFGKEAEHHVHVLQEVLSLPHPTLPQTAIDRGWRAIHGLGDMLRSLPPGPERELVAFEVERAMAGLKARMEGYAAGWVDNTEFEYAEAIQKGDAALRGPVAEAAVKAAGTLVKSVTPTEAAKVLARLEEFIERRPEDLRRLWAHFGTAQGAADGLRLSAEAAAERAPAMLAVLRQPGLTRQQRLSALWGHLVNIRSPLGEAYGFGDKVWLDEIEKVLAGSRKLATELGPGHTVEYLTQAANDIRINGVEGPDAMALISHRHTPLAYVSLSAQNKIARVSEGAEQSANDVLRWAGFEVGRVQQTATISFTRAPGEKPVTLLLAWRPEVRTQIYLINAAGSRTPAAQMAALQAYGLPIREMTTDLTLTHFTHLTLSVAESAIDVLRRGH